MMSGHWGITRLALTPLHKRYSREHMARMQDQRLRWLVKHAERTMPFYRELLKECGLSADRITGIRDLPSLPIVTKEMLRQAGRSAWATDGKHERYLQSSTSGSSGVPLTVVETLMDRAHYHAVNFDSLFGWGWRPWHRGLALGSEALPAPHPLWRLGLFRWPRVSTTRPVSEWLEEYERIRPHAMHSYPSALREFCFEAKARGGIDWKPRVLSVGGELFAEDLKPLVSEVFGRLPYVMYGAVEGGRLAAGCSAGEGLHVRPEAVHIELLRDGQAVPEGETGSVHVTALLNTALPLIRYELGDLACWIPGDCSCGLWWPRLDMQRGRRGEILPLPGGRRVAITALGGIVGRSQAVRQYQFVRMADDVLLLRYEAVNPAAEIEDGVLSELLAALPGIELRSEKTGQLARTASGKVRKYVPEP
jgi:phenylacetate-CoA ligase